MSEEDKLKGLVSFKEFSDWVFKTGQLPYNQCSAIDWSKCTETIQSQITSILTKKFNSTVLISTPPGGKKGFFWNEHSTKQNMEKRDD